MFTVLWALRSTHMFVRDIPMSAFYWDIWVQSSFVWCALLFVVFTMRYVGLRRPRFERLLLLYALLGPISMYVAGPARLHTVANNWSFAVVPVAIFFEGFLIRVAVRSRKLEDALLATVWALVILGFGPRRAGASRQARVRQLLSGFLRDDPAVSGGGVASGRPLRAGAEPGGSTNLELEQRVADKHAELAQNFRRLEQIQRETAIFEERQRLMSEMHDGIGSQLIATLDLVEQADAPKTTIATALRECLDSLRLTIDSLEPIENDLLTLMGNLRYRLEGRLKKQGIMLDWRVRDVPRLASLSPQNVLHILRILQEAFTNIIKHADARTITVQTGVNDEHICIEVADDGRGFTSERTGRGLASMQWRARALRAKLNIVPTPAGTTLSLHIPRCS